MENQGSALDFELWQLRHENMSKTLEEFHCTTFTKCKDIENQLDSNWKWLKAHSEQLVQRENEVLSKEKQFEAKELELKQLDGMQKSSLELSKEIEQKQKQCRGIEVRIEEKEREFLNINSSVLDAENKLDTLQRSIEEQAQKHEGMLKEYKQVSELKEHLLYKKQSFLEKCMKEIELQEDLLGKKQKSLENCTKKIELKEDLLGKMQRSVENYMEDCKVRESFIDNYDKQIKLKEEKLVSYQTLIDECSDELNLKKHQLDLVQKLKAENSDSLHKLMENCDHKVEEKEKNFENFVKELKLKEQFLESKLEELDLFDKKVVGCFKELELKERQFEKKAIEFKLKESEFERKANEFKLKESEFERKTNEFKLKESVFQRKENEFKLKESEFQRKASEFELKERDFERMDNEYRLKESEFQRKASEFELKERDFERMANEFRLKESEFQRKASQFELKERDFERMANEFKLKESEFQRKVSEFELRQKGFAPIERSPVLVVKEKTNLSSASPLSCVTNGEKDLFWLLNEYLQKHDLVCSQILSVVKASSSSDPAKLVLDTINKIYHLHSAREKIEFEDSIARRGCSLLSEMLLKVSPEINPQVRKEAMKLASAWKASLNVASDNFEVWSLLQFLASFKLASAVDVNELHYLLDAAGLIIQTSQLRSPHGDIGECVRTLIQGEEIIRAVRLICRLKLRDMFPPLQLLIKFLEDIERSTQKSYEERKFYKAKKQSIDKEVAALKGVSECMKFCNLESEILSNKISKRFGILENMSQSLGREVDPSPKKKQRKIGSNPKENFARCSLTNKLGETVGAGSRSSGSRFPQSSSPLKIGTTTPPLVPKVANSIVGSYRSPSSASWTKPPKGSVKLNFSHTARPECSFLSVVARSHNEVLAIKCRKIGQSNPLTAEALAALGALTLASSEKWDTIFLEGESLLLMNNLQGISEPMKSISSVVSDSIAKMKTFKQVIASWIPAEANTMARNVARWAADNNVNGSSWISVPSDLVYKCYKV
ncbi:hypothetical protein F8388_009976 [Cannabis sativa]|uniref:RNase H type-1 domain-containing protein n=2 Tax=Cannabis sativa TaxID=3483 RepID=A0AB40E7N6_CANSA|nr:hypothetical protein F8388_009976 [Cannabis sativa]KAF4395077.1 hypothetical protein G4B88_017947 [Cannabis sativa]